jgi:hypothetical protein
MYITVKNPSWKFRNIFMKARTLSSIFLNFSILSYLFLNIHLYRAFGSKLPHTFFTVLKITLTMQYSGKFGEKTYWKNTDYTWIFVLLTILLAEFQEPDWFHRHFYSRVAIYSSFFTAAQPFLSLGHFIIQRLSDYLHRAIYQFCQDTTP